MSFSLQIFKLTIIFCILLFPNLLFGQQKQDSVQTKYKNNLVPSPSLTYSPETSLVIGAFGLYQFKPKKADHLTRPSNIVAYAASSLYKQVTFRLQHSLLLPPADNLFFTGLIEYKRWPEQYFGIGPDSEEDDLKISDYYIITVEQKAYKNLGKQLFIGLQFEYMNLYKVKFYDTDGNEILPPDEVVGEQGGPFVGLGFGIIKDERNSLLTPTAKYYFEFSSYFYNKALGSTTNFLSFLIDGRKYIDFNTKGKHVLAFHGKAIFTSGNVPFIELAKLGGKQIMRGYLEGRFRDKQYMQAQAEYRVNVIGRFGLTAFAGIGNVMPKLNEFDPSSLKFAAGGGFRFNINRKDPANVRIDVGFGKNSTGIYVTFGEAF